MRPILLLVLFAAFGFGCTPRSASKPAPKPKAGSGVSKPKAAPKTPLPPRKPGDPFDLSDKKVLGAIYRAMYREGAERRATYLHYGLLDDAGSPNRQRWEAFRVALRRFAQERPKDWSELVDKLYREERWQR